MSDRPDNPIPDDVEGLIDWIDESFPELSPRHPDDYVECLKRGAVRELVSVLRGKLAHLHEDRQ